MNRTALLFEDAITPDTAPLPELPRSNRNHAASAVLAAQSILGWLGRRYVQYHPILAELAGIKPAILLGHALYWTRVCLTQQPERGGWFWKTGTEWEAATGLSADEQQSARAILTRARLLTECRRGMPARLWFHVELEQLAARLAPIAGIAGMSDAPEAGKPSWLYIEQLLGRPVLFFRPLADVAGNVTAGLYLSHLLAALRLAGMRNQLSPTGAFLCPIEQSMSRLKMGAKSIRNARIRLHGLGVLNESWTSGLQPRQLLHIDLHKLQLLLQPPQARQRSVKPRPFPETGMADSANQGMPFSRNWNGGNAQSRDALFPKQGMPNAGNKNQEKGGSINKEVNTNKKEQQQPPRTDPQPKPDAGKPPGGGSGFLSKIPQPAPDAAWIFPDALTELERRAAAALLRRMPPEPGQQVLDEWAGQLARKPISNKLGYLRSIVQAAAAGEFVPTVAAGVEQQRRREAELRALRTAADQKLREEVNREQGRQGYAEAMAAIRALPGFRKRQRDEQ